MTVRELIEQSAEDLRRQVEEHRRLVTSVLDSPDGADGTEFNWFRSTPEPIKFPATCPHRRKLRETITEAIEVLEKTRKAFKSRQLESLRRKLTRILAEDN